MNGRSFRDDPIVPTERVYPPKKGEPDGERGDQWLIVLLVTSCDSSEEERKYGRGGLIHLALSLFNICSRLTGQLVLYPFSDTSYEY